MRGTRTTAAVAAALLAGSALLLTACGGSTSDGASSAAVDSAPAQSQDGEASGDQSGRANALSDLSMADAGTTQSDVGAPSKAAEASVGGTLSEVTIERQVIATAEMTLRSVDVDATVDTVESIATAANGYVSARDVQSNPDDPDRTRATIVVRVPTAKLDVVIDDVTAEGDLVRVVSDEQDVTQTVVDVDSRVRSAQASVNRIRVLLSEANTIGDVVRIESELARREADLESLQAQQRALADQTALATLSVTVLAPEAAAPGPTPGTDEDGFVAGLQRGWTALVDVVVVALTTVGVVLPFAVVGLLVALPFAAAWRRRHRATSPDPAANV
jgi:hypothetical protein